jgi:hypothetical protein
MKRWSFIAAMLLAGSASAQSVATGAQGHWSVVTGETVSPDRDALRVDLGWPGIGFTYLHGLSERRDIGVRFDLLYGFEQTNNSKFGIGMGVPLRLVVNRSDRISVEVHIEPGLRIYPGDSLTGATDFFIRAPFGGTIGIQVTPELRLAAGADLNFALQIPHTAYLEIGPMFGFAAEYAVDRRLNLAFNTRFGPQFYSISGSNTDFAFITDIVVGYRL